jgi:hypothetical protein
VDSLSPPTQNMDSTDSGQIIYNGEPNKWPFVPTSTLKPRMKMVAKSLYFQKLCMP